MATNSRNESQLQNPTFIFKGTVRKVRGATMRRMPVDKQTIIVMVDQVLEAPANLAKFGGSEITVQLTGRQKAKVGEALIFHTRGWIFGESIAVHCDKLEELKRSHAGLLSRGGDPVQHRKNRVMRERFDQASTVVSGRVSAVRLPDGGTQTRGRRAAAAAAEPVITGPISEHNPHWREAVIEIDDVHKGSHSAREVVVHFPASIDVRWYKAPKFHPGQQGYFMLQKSKIRKRPAARGATRAVGALAAEPATEEVYTALHPVDFQPYTEPDGIKRILDANASNDES